MKNCRRKINQQDFQYDVADKQAILSSASAHFFSV